LRQEIISLSEACVFSPSQNYLTAEQFLHYEVNPFLKLNTVALQKIISISKNGQYN